MLRRSMISIILMASLFYHSRFCHDISDCKQYSIIGEALSLQLLL